MDMGSSGTIVVGIDDSEDARLALEYAVQEAALRGATVRAVATFESSGVFGDRYGLPIPVSDEQIAKSVQTDANTVISDVLDRVPERPEIEWVVKAGDAGVILAAESATADLLVVGHRGRGPMASAILGSVGLHCVLHAQCTVTVVRRSAEPAA
jgi:nucleotide-binding universal stress UspA family protein